MVPALDTLHHHLTTNELKLLLRRAFVKADCPPALFDGIDGMALLIHRDGFAAVLGFLKFAAESRHGHPPSAT